MLVKAARFLVKFVFKGNFAILFFYKYIEVQYQDKFLPKPVLIFFAIISHVYIYIYIYRCGAKRWTVNSMFSRNLSKTFGICEV